MLNTRIKAFVELGKKIEATIGQIEGMTEGLSTEQNNMLVAYRQASHKNGWFTTHSIEQAMQGIVVMLKEEALVEWISKYIDDLSKTKGGKEIGLIMAGNIPAVGFHDFLCVLLSGNKAICKLSSDDDILLPAIGALLLSIEKEFEGNFEFLNVPRNQYDAVIATGSNNSARYFEQYFSKFPNIIRKSRTSVAVVTESTSDEDIAALSNDMFAYFGLGCRNVSKILLVGNVQPAKIMDVLQNKIEKLDLSKYQNNLDYHKSIYLINRVSFLDGGAFLFKEDEGLHSPITVTFFEHYLTLADAEQYVSENAEDIQCVVSPEMKEGVAFGAAQTPDVWDYADKVDTLAFLIAQG